MEILIAMVLLSVVGATALSSFSSSTKAVPSNNNTAFNFARAYMEQLYGYVRQDTWDQGGNLLVVGNTTLPSANPQTLDGVQYTGAPVTTGNPGGHGEDYRKVKLTVSW